MTDAVKGSIPDKDTATELFACIATRFAENKKGETTVLLNQLTNIKYQGNSGVREHILRLIEIVAKLKDLDVPIDDQLLVVHVLNSLSTDFSQLKTTYNAQKENGILMS